MKPSSETAAALPWPETLSEIAESEQFLAWAFRRWVLGLHQNEGAHWSLVWNEFARQFGARDGKAALAGFAALVRELQGHARRTVGYHQPCCPMLGPDEATLIGFVAACQQGQWSRARAQAEWLLLPEGIGGFLEAGARLGALMERHGFRLPMRLEGARRPAGEARPELAGTLH